MLKLKLQYFGHLMQIDNSLQKSLMLGKDRGQKEKRVSEDEMAGWHHRCNEHELGQTPGDGEGQKRPGMLQSREGITVPHSDSTTGVLLTLFGATDHTHISIYCPFMKLSLVEFFGL